MSSREAPPRIGRRTWLRVGGASAALGAALGVAFWRTVAEEAREAGGLRGRARGPLGALRPDPNGILDLPEGFSYVVVDRAGEEMSDGFVTPSRFDGMGVFDGPEPGTWAILRNHENPSNLASFGPAPDGRPIPEAFDAGKPGGVTRVVVDATTLARRSSNLVLAGTVLNCAGGVSPWGWLSCEETIEEGHGYVFVCDPSASRVQPARPVRAFGRFRHEAACVDPARGIVYLSEDRPDSCLYRFVPRDVGEPFEGRLEALRVVGHPRCDTARELAVGARVRVDWVPLDRPDVPDDTLRVEAQARGAAIIRRGEGLAFADEHGAPRVLLSATEGGRAGLGQILRLDPDDGTSGRDSGTLTSLAESTDQEDFDMPDNLAVAPGGHLYFCEDGHARNYVRALGPSGVVYDVARNALSRSELTGVSFTPDGGTMFVGIQQDGLLLAVRGPFARA